MPLVGVRPEFAPERPIPVPTPRPMGRGEIGPAAPAPAAATPAPGPVPEPAPAVRPSLLVDSRQFFTPRNVAATAARTIAPVVGAIAGAPFIPVAGPLAPVGGAAIGTGIVEPLVQRYIEQRPISWSETALEAGISALPAGAAGRTLLRNIGKRALMGGAIGGGGEVARSYLRTGEAPSAQRVLGSTATGLVLGGGLGAAESRFLASRLPALATAAPEAARPPVGEVPEPMAPGPWGRRVLVDRYGRPFAPEPAAPAGAPDAPAPRPPSPLLAPVEEPARPPSAVQPAAPIPAPAAPAAPGANELVARGVRDRTTTFRQRVVVRNLEDLALNDPAAQPRYRSAAGAQNQVQRLAKRFDPDAYIDGNAELKTGLPIIGPDNVVESGNGRLMALAEIRRNDPNRFAQITGRMRERAAEFGVDPATMPPGSILVRERLESTAELGQKLGVPEAQARLEWAKETNLDVSLSRSSRELAREDVNLLQPADVADLVVGETETLEGALGAVRNRPTIGRFLNALPPNERDALVASDGKSLTPAGIMRLKNAIVRYTFPGEEGERLLRAATESTDPGIKNVELGLFGSAGQLATIRATRPEYDIAADLARATDVLVQLRRVGWTVDDYLRQGELPGTQRALTPEGERWLVALDQAKNTKQVRDQIQRYATLVSQQAPPGQQGLLASAVPRSKGELTELALSMPRGLFGGERGAAPVSGFGVGRLRTYFDELRQEAAKMEAERLKRKAESAAKVTPQLAIAGLTETGTAPPPAGPPQQLLVDQFNRPIGPRLSSTDPERLAPSFYGGLTPTAEAMLTKQALAFRDEIEYARRGVVPTAYTQAKAHELEQHIANLLDDETAVARIANLRRRGQALNSEQLTTAVYLHNRFRQKALEDTDNALRPGATEIDRLRAIRSGLLSIQMLKQAVGAAAEPGRALRMLRFAMQDPNGQAMKYAIKQFGGDAGIDEILRAIRGLGNDPLQLNMFLQGIRPSTRWEKFRELYINALMSAPKGRVADFLSTLAFIMERPARELLAGAVDPLRARIEGTARERWAMEGVQDLMGMFAGLRQGGRAFLRTLVTEIPSDGVSRVLDPGVPRRAIKGRLGRIIRIPGTFAAAQDDFLKAVSGQGHLYALAYRRAMREGRTGDNLAKRMAEIVSNPHAIEGLTETIDVEKLYRTFQDPLGKGGTALMQLRDYIKPMLFALPFVRTLWNLSARSVDIIGRIPRFAYKAKTGQLPRGGELSDELAELAIAAGLAGVVATYVAQGRLTGSGPANREERREKIATGWRPNSWEIGGQYVSYNRFDPWGAAIGTMADMFELGALVEHEDAVTAIAAHLVSSASRNFLSKTWTQGLSDAIEATDDPDRYLPRYLAKLGANVATPTLLAHLARAWDPVVRKPRTTEQVFAARVPGLTSHVPVVRDVWGRVVIREGGFVETMLSPLERVRIDQDPASKEIRRLGVAPGSPQRALTVRGERIDFSDAEYDRYTEAAGQAAWTLITNFVQRPGYARLSDQKKAEGILYRFERSREMVRDRMRRGVVRGSRTEAAEAGR